MVARYTQGPNIDEPLARQRGTTTGYYEQDDVGSVTSLSSTACSVAQSYAFDSFGNTSNSSGSLTNFFRYTGREFDSESGMYYYRARYYDPQSGRFVSEDPISLNAGIDFYSYVNNRPISRRDPVGEYDLPGAAVGAIVGGVYGAIGAGAGPDSSVGSIALGFATGAATGGLIGLFDPSLGIITVGIISGVGDLAGQVVSGHGLNKCKSTMARLP